MNWLQKVENATAGTRPAPQAGCEEDSQTTPRRKAVFAFADNYRPPEQNQEMSSLPISAAVPAVFPVRTRPNKNFLFSRETVRARITN
jgi:hypothetical protein